MRAGLWRSDNPEEQAIYLPPCFCLVSPLLSEVKGYVKDEAEPSIRHPAELMTVITAAVSIVLHPIRITVVTVAHRNSLFHPTPCFGDVSANVL